MTAPEGGLVVEAIVSNSGDVALAEIARLYVGHGLSPADRPVYVLKGFSRITLSAGKSAGPRFRVRVRELARCGPGHSPGLSTRASTAFAWVLARPKKTRAFARASPWRPGDRPRTGGGRGAQTSPNDIPISRAARTVPPPGGIVR